MPLPLVDRSKEEIEQIIRRRVEAMKDVRGCRELNIRMSGKRFDVNMLVLLDDNLRFEDTHKISANIERDIRTEFPNARVTIHTEPARNDLENIWKLVKKTAEETPGSRGVHNIHIQRINQKLCIDLHLEVSANMTVKEAHETAHLVETRIRESNPKIAEITIHIESASDQISRERAGVEIEMESYIEHVAKQFPGIKGVDRISIRRFGDSLHLVLQCRFDPKLSIRRAHEISNELEKTIRTAYPKITRIDIHEEPA